jgi:hypothetical protein
MMNLDHAPTSPFRVAPLVARPVATGVLWAAAVIVLATHTGCYKRVVKAEGIGASTMTVQEPTRTQGPIDRAVYGGESSSTRKNRPSGYTPRK